MLNARKREIETEEHLRQVGRSIFDVAAVITWDVRLGRNYEKLFQVPTCIHNLMEHIKFLNLNHPFYLIYMYIYITDTYNRENVNTKLYTYIYIYYIYIYIYIPVYIYFILLFKNNFLFS